jgi:hypothetical protein
VNPLSRVLTLGAVLMFASACGGTEQRSAAAPAPSPSGNTAAICKSGGEAARKAVLELFGKMAGEDDLATAYKSTFGTLRDDLSTASGQATDPEFAAVLKAIADEAGKIATASDPEAVGTEGFQAALGKLETYCPSGSPGASTAPGGVVSGAVGAEGSGCELPVTFSVAPKWQPKDVTTDDNDPLAALTRKGSLRMRCEISARPAGLTGFLRVWIGPPAGGGDSRAALKELLTGTKNRKAVYTPVVIGGRDGTELTYELYSELMEEYSRRQAFAVETPAGAVVVELSGLESDDPAMLSAYELAKSSLTVTS